MHKLCYWFLLLILISVPVFGAQTKAGAPLDPIQITLKEQLTLTPTDKYSTGVFPRIIYHPVKQKFYLIFGAAKVGTVRTAGFFNPQDLCYAWYEFDLKLKPTGKTGALPIKYTGDFALTFDGSNYYTLHEAPRRGPQTSGGFMLYKYDADFNLIKEAYVSWDMNKEAGNDQLLSYTNGKLYFSSLYDTQGAGEMYRTGKHDGATYPHVFIYDTNLAEVEKNRYLMDESNVPAGGSLIYHEGIINLVTADQMRDSKLYVYQWDKDWKYLGKKLLAADGQWSQGLLFDQGRFYVVYHVGRHAHGNVALGIYDKNWKLLFTRQLTNYSSEFNAQRPWIIKVGKLLYISYDVASFDPVNHKEGADWQAHVDVYEIKE